MQEVRTWVRYNNQVCWLQMHAPRSLQSSVLGRCAPGQCSSVEHKLICKVLDVVLQVKVPVKRHTQVPGGL